MIATNERYKDGRIVYLHDCPKCGKENSARGTKNKPTQCEDCRQEGRACNIPTRLTHGESKTKMHSRWKSMKQRCFNENHPRYADWGGRNITVCEEWKDDYITYKNYIDSLENAHKEEYTVDRINNNGNYEPGNMKWSTPAEQNLNQRHKKTNTGEPGITKDNSYSGKKIYRVKNGKRFKTIEEAINHRKEKYGF